MKKISKLLIIFLLLTQFSFSASKPVPSIGIVVKKQPGQTEAKIFTGKDGSFSADLEEGKYELIFSQEELQTVINGIIRNSYSKSDYQYDGSGIEIILDNPQIRVNSRPIDANTYTFNKQISTLTITVPSGGATLSGILNWNDVVLTDLGSVSDQSEKKGLNAVNVKKSKTDLGSESAIDQAQRKGINEGGLKKNEIENIANEADVKAIAETMVNRKGIDQVSKENGNRISMNITVPKQTQGATFGEKGVDGKINITLVEEGCVVLFSNNTGYRINTAEKSINELSRNEVQKVNQGLHAAGSALAQGASLLGGALPGGAIISAAVSSVGNLAGGTGGGAAAASYAKSGKKVWKINDNESDATLELVDGDYELKFIVTQKATSGLKDTLKTQVLISFTIENGSFNTKDALKSVLNIIR